MRYQIAASILLFAGVLSNVGAAQVGCAEARESAIGNIPGYESDPGLAQPKYVKTLERCMARHPICLLLKDGKVVGGGSESAVRVKQKAVVFAFVQHLRMGTQSYCAMASRLPVVGADDPEWFYRTFTPEGGWIGEELYDASSRPKTSAEVFGMLGRNFELFKQELKAETRARRRQKDIPECGWSIEPAGPPGDGQDGTRLPDPAPHPGKQIPEVSM